LPVRAQELRGPRHAATAGTASAVTVRRSGIAMAGRGGAATATRGHGRARRPRPQRAAARRPRLGACGHGASWGRARHGDQLWLLGASRGGSKGQGRSRWGWCSLASVEVRTVVADTLRGRRSETEQNVNRYFCVMSGGGD
jgi:hypothetical protein